MDMRTLAKVLQEANRLIPEQVRDEIAAHIEVAAAVLSDFGDALDEATEQSSNANRKDIWSNLADGVQTPDEVRREKRTFEDVMQGWDIPSENVPAAEQPDAESGGSEDVDSIVRDIYRFMTVADEDYAPANAVYEDWNARHPLFVVIDFLKYLGEAELTGMDDDK